MKEIPFALVVFMSFLESKRPDIIVMIHFILLLFSSCFGSFLRSLYGVPCFEFFIFSFLFFLGSIALFHFFSIRRMNPSFFKLMYFVIIFAVFLFASSLRHSLYLGGGFLVFYMFGPGDSGNLETSPPAMSQQGAGGNEPSIRGDSLLRNLEQPRGEAGASSSQGRDVILEGRPIKDEEEWGVLASPFYMSKVVHLSGEIEDPLTFSKLGKLNGLLLFISDQFLGEWNPAI